MIAVRYLTWGRLGLALSLLPWLSLLSVMIIQPC